MVFISHFYHESPRGEFFFETQCSNSSSSSSAAVTTTIIIIIIAQSISTCKSGFFFWILETIVTECNQQRSVICNEHFRLKNNTHQLKQTLLTAAATLIFHSPKTVWSDNCRSPDTTPKFNNRHHDEYMPAIQVNYYNVYSFWLNIWSSQQFLLISIFSLSLNVSIFLKLLSTENNSHAHKSMYIRGNRGMQKLLLLLLLLRNNWFRWCNVERSQGHLAKTIN